MKNHTFFVLDYEPKDFDKVKNLLLSFRFHNFNLGASCSPQIIISNGAASGRPWFGYWTTERGDTVYRWTEQRIRIIWELLKKRIGL